MYSTYKYRMSLSKIFKVKKLFILCNIQEAAVAYMIVMILINIETNNVMNASLF